MKNITVISSYPKKSEIHGNSTVGVASYAKNTLLSVADASGKNLSITVLAEKLEGETGYKKNNVNVKRIWKRNSFMIFPKLLKEVLISRTNTVVIEFELAMFGEFRFLLPFPIFLMFLKIFNKKSILILHQVVPDMSKIGPHVNIESGSIKSSLFSLFLSIFYKYLLLISTKIIVFEQSLKDSLAKFGSIKNVVVIPHGVEQFLKKPSKYLSRKKLGFKRNDFVVVVFGYLAWYKGTDWILNAIENINTKKVNNIRLLLAGGPNPNNLDKEYYLRYINSVYKKADELSVKISGFVNEKDIANYYQAADVIVLPYRSHMSASGPLSMAFAFKKPFLLSQNLKCTLYEADFARGMKKNKISFDKIIFKESDDFIKRIGSLSKNKVLRSKLSKLSKELSHERSWDRLGKLYYEEFSI